MNSTSILTVANDVTSIGEAVCRWSHDIVYIIDKAGIIKDGNDRLWTDLGLSKSQSEKVSLLATVVEDERSIALRTWYSILKDRRSEHAIRKVKTAKGDLRVLGIVESPILAEGREPAIIGIARDITEETAVADKFWGSQLQSHSELEYAVRASLGIIKGYVYSLQKLDTMPIGSRERFSRIIVEEVEAMSRNIDNLLISRGDCFRNSEETVFDLAEVVAETIISHIGESERRKIPIMFERPRREVNFFGQPLVISRILSNLLDYLLFRVMHSGEIRVHIRDFEEYVDIVVVDTAASFAQVRVDQLLSETSDQAGATITISGGKFDYDVACLLANSVGGGVIPRAGDSHCFELTVMLPRSIYATVQDELSTAQLAR